MSNWWWATAPETVAPFPAGIVPRGPLPPFPAMPPNYDAALWYAPPTVADRRYWRCNFGTVTIPGLPWVPGMEDTNYDRVLTGFLGRYSTEWQQTIATTYRQRGYTHFLRWVQDELLGTPQTVQQYVDSCKMLKDTGIAYVCHSFLSKTYAPSNCDRAYCAQQFDAVIDALLSAGVLDAYTVGFELNLVNPSSNLLDLIDYFAVERDLTEATGHPGYVHFTSGYTWPGPIGVPMQKQYPDRRSWWNVQQGKLTGLLYQNDPEWSIDQAQARYRDTTDNAGEGFPGTDSGFGHPFDFVALETRLSLAFGNDAIFNENDLDQFGYLSLCTLGQVPVLGFGCGARRPDGSYL